jgi:hypothetical protein
MLEIDEQGQPEIGDGQITHHLGDMRRGEILRHLGISNYQIIDDHIGNERVDHLPVIPHIKSLLLVDPVTLLAQLNDEGVSYAFSSNPGFNVFRTFIAAPMIALLTSPWII